MYAFTFFTVRRVNYTYSRNIVLTAMKWDPYLKKPALTKIFNRRLEQRKCGDALY
jgi:hypothetical protein